MLRKNEMKIILASFVLVFALFASPDKSYSQDKGGPDLNTSVDWTVNMINKHCRADPHYSNRGDIECSVTISGTQFSYVEKGTYTGSRHHGSKKLPYHKTVDFDLTDLDGAYANSDGYDFLKIGTRRDNISIYVKQDKEENRKYNDTGFKIAVSNLTVGKKIAKALMHVQDLLKGSTKGSSKDENLF